MYRETTHHHDAYINDLFWCLLHFPMHKKLFVRPHIRQAGSIPALTQRNADSIFIQLLYLSIETSLKGLIALRLDTHFSRSFASFSKMISV